MSHSSIVWRPSGLGLPSTKSGFAASVRDPIFAAMGSSKRGVQEDCSGGTESRYETSLETEAAIKSD